MVLIFGIGQQIIRTKYLLKDFRNQDYYNTISKTFTKMDFYAEMAGIPGLVLGVPPSELEDTFKSVQNFTPYSYKKLTPKNHYKDTIEQFFMDNLGNDNPVLMLNLSEFGQNTKYINGANQKFTFHWMTVTKFFKGVIPDTSAIAISSWAERFSVNIKLLMDVFNPNYYYSDFYCYELGDTK